jgi:SH3 domain protein
MKHRILGLMATAALLSGAYASAETAYVSDDLILGVYADKNQQGARLATLHSGASVEVLARDGEYAQVRLPNGNEGWVKASFLTTHETSGIRVKALEEELSRIKSTTPAMAEAAARAELQNLKQQLDAKQQELDALKAQGPAPPPAATRSWVAPALAAGLLGLALGFAWGYATLARRIREKFGGVKVY